LGQRAAVWENIAQLFDADYEPTNVTDVAAVQIPYLFGLRKLSSTNALLDGAGFALYDDDPRTGTASEVPGLVAVDVSTCLDSETCAWAATVVPGTYWLQETVAPRGYQLLAEPIKVTFNHDGTFEFEPQAGTIQAGQTCYQPGASLVPASRSSLTEVSEPECAAAGGLWVDTLDVTNTRLPELPFVGGRGHAIMWWLFALGACCMGYAVIRRRNQSQLL
jgi:hypothetical protein